MCARVSAALAWRSLREARGTEDVEALPGVEEAAELGEVDGGLEEVGEGGGGEEVGAWAVGEDAAFAHEEDAADFGDDVADLVGDEEDAGAALGESAEEIAQVALGGEVEGV